MTDIVTSWNVTRGVGDWAIESGALASGGDLATAVLVSLFTDRRAGDDDALPDGSDDRRGWWGDLEQDVAIGSRLWLLERSRLTEEVAGAAADYAREALQWLLDDKVASGIRVGAVLAGRSQLNLAVTVTRSNGEKLSLQYNWAWPQA